MEYNEGVRFKYDNNGNMIEKITDGVLTRYFYNVEDRLVRIEDGLGNAIAKYYYDPFGRRLWKENAGIRIYFHYSSDGLIGKYSETGDVIRLYGYKTNKSWAANPFFIKVGDEYYFYQNDHLGTHQLMTNRNGVVVWSAQYSSFGEAKVDIETIQNNLRFPGQYYDIETGFHYNRFRYYSPQIGRYLRSDPLKLNSGDINLFRCARNNPLKVLGQK